MSDPSAVAIVGMSGQFPGARDIDEYWANLAGGVCSIATFTDEELLADGVDPAVFGRADYVPAGGHLADADRFEPELFGFNRTEAAILDPQQRLLLQAAWSALEDAGFDPYHAPARTGVYLGGSLTEHMLAAHTDPRVALEHGDLQVRILTDRQYLAPWVSYRLGLDGPSFTVESACSTSLTAVHVAVQALILGECDAALAGGASVSSVHRRGYVYRDGGVLSPDGVCRPFDEKAAGTVPGQGVGVVVLRRLSDAIADGDPIHAVIRGTAVTNDGRNKVGFTAPSVARQSAAIVEAWTAAGLEPASAQYLEMHGTGTELGDPIEVAAASAALGGSGAARCPIGSVKSNVGHLDAAAGVAGLIKVALMLTHRTVAPMVNVRQPHPDLHLDRTPFTLATEATAWPRPAAGPRLAGVSSIGIGGTNVHAVVEEAPRPDRRPPADRREVLPISAHTEAQLRTLAGRLASALRAPGAPVLADVAHTLRLGRAALPVRAYVVATSRASAADAFAALAAGDPVLAADPLGAAWVRGEAVDWPVPAGARRVHLPTYPFAGERFPGLTLGGAPSPAASPGPSEPPPGLTVEVAGEVLLSALGLTEDAELDTSFAGAGGDSLTAVHLAGRFRDEFDVDVPIELFLSPMSLRQLAAQVVAAGAGDTLLATLLDEV